MKQHSRSPWHIGLRTTKTAIASIVCVLLFHLLNRGSPMLAVLSTVFSLRTDHNETWKFGKSRLFGNIFGGLVAITFIFLRSKMLLPQLSDLIFTPIGIVVIILFCNRFNENGIINSTATFLVVFFNVEASQNIEYATQRVLDTLIGAIIAVAINYTLPNPHLKRT